MIEELDTIHGKMFMPDTDTAQYAWLRITGASPEEEFIDTVCKILAERPRGVAVDAGANFGCWALPLARVATRVACYEPQPVVAECLARTIVAHPELQIFLLRAAVGAESGNIKVPMIKADAAVNFGGVTLGIPHHEAPDAPMVTVPVVTLDELHLHGDPVSFIKIDVEGHEQLVLKGAEKLIAHSRPVLFVEAVHKYTDTDALQKQIESMGYGVVPKGPNFLGMPI